MSVRGSRVEPISVTAGTPVAQEEDGISFRTYPEPDHSGSVPRALPPELLRLTYQNRLRSIGRHLDVNSQRSIFILEVEGGFIVRCVSRSDRDIDLLEFTDDSYAERMIQATEARGEGERGESPSPMAPTGYEDLLRAVGRFVDQRQVRNLVIAEKRTSMVVMGDGAEGNGAGSLEMEFDADGITSILNEAFNQRSSERQGNEP